jgi:hypothetical protein
LAAPFSAGDDALGPASVDAPAGGFGATPADVGRDCTADVGATAAARLDGGCGGGAFTDAAGGLAETGGATLASGSAAPAGLSELSSNSAAAGVASAIRKAIDATAVEIRRRRVIRKCPDLTACTCRNYRCRPAS